MWAILTLGRWFTYDVRVAEGQPVVTTGPYRWVRHHTSFGPTYDRYAASKPHLFPGIW